MSTQIQVDCKGQSIGRLAMEIMYYLRSMDDLIRYDPRSELRLGTERIVNLINVDSIKINDQWRSYKTYSGHKGLKSVQARRMLQENPLEAIRKTVWGMMPKNGSSRKLIRNIRIQGYDGEV